MITRISGFRDSFIRCLAFAVMVTAVSASAAAVNVSVLNNRFQPASVTIQVNDEVTWTWAAADGGVFHTTTSDPPGLWDSQIHAQPFDYTVPFPTAGSFPYVCSLHASIGMVGTVTVQGTSSLPPTITTQPTNRTVNVGDTVTFNVVATGSAPLSYQWKKGTSNLPGANAATLTLTTVTVADAGSYTVVVTNMAGSTTSDAAILTVNSGGSAPVITTQPASQTVAAGQPVTFNVVATGSPPLSYQWKKGAANIPGANAASLNLNAVTSADAGSYTVVVTNTAGSVTSDAAVLTVDAGGGVPVITTQPASQTVAAGQPVTFNVVATGTAPLSYQWRKGTTNVAGANQASLTLNAVTSADAGSYTVVVTNTVGSVTSDAAVLTVNSGGGAPVITTQPASHTVSAGQLVVFTVVATGTPPLSYQWKKGATNVPGAIQASLIFAATSADAGSYTVVVTNMAGSVTSDAAVLTVNAGGGAPVITTQPASQTVAPGQPVTFNVVASGTPPLSYQWKKGATSIPGATDVSFTLTAATTADAGSYTVVVTNTAGSVTSDAAVLTVNAGGGVPVITQQPISQTVSVGANVTFSVTATSGSALSYQWRKTGAMIPGATSSSYVLNNVQTNNAGSYSVMVNNAAGSVTSADALLTVQPNTTVTFAAGSFNGLFSDPNGVSHESSGSVTLNITPSGKFTGKLLRGGVRSSLSGQFDLNGHAQKIIPSIQMQSVTVDLQVDMADPDRLTGTVSDGTFNADLLADRAGFDGRQNLAPQAGRYTLVLDGNEGEFPTTPGGYGFATVTVNSAGVTRLAATLADGTKLSQSVPLSKDGDWPLFGSLHSGKGFIMSWAKFAETTSEDIDGEVIWLKPAVPRAKLYPIGFTFSTALHGSRYQAAGKVLDFSNGQLTLEGGGLQDDIVNQITLGDGNRVTNLSTNKLNLTFSASTGLFSGRVEKPGSSTSISFKGAVLQKQNVGFGWFAGQNKQSGEVTLSGE